MNQQWTDEKLTSWSMHKAVKMVTLKKCTVVLMCRKFSEAGSKVCVKKIAARLILNVKTF